MKIGVFDSGIGGERIAKLLQQEFSNTEIINVSDRENLPYGNKTIIQLKNLVIPKIVDMENQGCDIVVIACNTVTTNIIKDVRAKTKIPIVGFEPMIKSAAKITKNKHIVVCATEATLKSKRYQELKRVYGKDLSILEPDCSDWANLIEKNLLNTKHIQKILNQTLKNNADVLVLGCTHYHWIEQLLYDKLEGQVAILQPEEAIIRRIKILTNSQKGIK